MLLLTSKGGAGVSGSAIAVLAMTLAATKTIPVGSIALILGIHRVLSAAFVFTNIAGNCVATIMIGKWEKAIDTTVLDAELNARRWRLALRILLARRPCRGAGRAIPSGRPAPLPTWSTNLRADLDDDLFAAVAPLRLTHAPRAAQTGTVCVDRRSCRQESAKHSVAIFS